MVTPEDLERERYEARLKMQRDISSALVAARDDGIEKGRKEELVEHIHFLQQLLRRAEMPAEQLLALPLDELERVAQQLETEVARRLSSAPSETR